MRPISDVRRKNLAQLVEDHGGQSAFAQLIGKDKNQVYQWLLAPGNPQSRNIGERSARLIEGICGKETGWIDTPQDKFSGGQSHSVSLDRAILHEALTLLTYDEYAGGQYSARQRTDRLAHLYEWVERDGGRLTAASNVEFTDEVNERRQLKGVSNDKRNAGPTSPKPDHDGNAPGAAAYRAPGHPPDGGRVHEGQTDA